MKKNYEIRLKVSKEELDKIRQKAQEVGLPVSAYVRSMALIAKPKSI